LTLLHWSQARILTTAAIGSLRQIIFHWSKHEGRSKPTIGPVQFLDRVIKL